MKRLLTSSRWATALIVAVLAGTFPAARDGVVVVDAATTWTGAAPSGSGAIPWQPFDGVDLGGGTSLRVNLANGNLMASADGPTVPGTNGFDESFGPVYNSLASGVSTDMGQGWGMGDGRDVGLVEDATSATFYDETGQGWTFQQPSSCSFTSPPGIDATLTCNTSLGGYILTDHASQTVYNFSPAGYLTSAVNRSGNTISYTYSSGVLSSMTNTENQSTTFGHDSSNRITGFGSPAGSWTYGYDTSNQLTTITDPNNLATHLSYDSAHHLTQVQDPKGNITLVTYDASNRVASITRVTNTTTNTGPTWTFSYGTTSTVTDPNSHTTTYGFDSGGRVNLVTDAMNNSAHYTWNADNQITQAQQPSGAITTYTYDSLNNLTKIQLPTGPTFQWQYTNTSLPYSPSAFIDEEGHTTTYGYNSQGLLTSEVDAANHTTTATYNAGGTLASITDANNHITSYSYSGPNGGPMTSGPVGLPTGITYPSPRGSERIGYDSAWRVGGFTDGRGQTTEYTYDNSGQPIQSRYDETAL